MPIIARHAPRSRSRRWLRAGTASLGVLGACAAGLSIGAAVLAVAPEPDPVPRRWQLDLTLGELRAITIDAGNKGAKTYLFQTYKVTNNSGEDVLFAPTFELSHSDGSPMRSGRDVPAEVTRKILGLIGNPLVQDQISILGVLLQGAANAKEGVVVWGLPDHDAPELSVYAAGFSGEMRTIEVKDATTKEMRKVILRKTLMAKYRNPGELRGDTTRPLDRIEERWVLR